MCLQHVLNLYILLLTYSYDFYIKTLSYTHFIHKYMRMQLARQTYIPAPKLKTPLVATVLLCRSGQVDSTMQCFENTKDLLC